MSFRVLISTVLFCLGYTKLTGQSLTFSQVKLVSTVETVPANTVWKINNVLPTAGLTDVGTPQWGSSRHFTVLINGQTIFWMSTAWIGTWNGSQSGVASDSQSIGDSPIWLPSGTSLAIGSNIHAISITEFNVIP
ncbi:MAG: hypothetical protein O3C32_02300 [Bacteroidetes bacterium]|nr:hypothetical protein [Bacteroidota bacterium]